VIVNAQLAAGLDCLTIVTHNLEPSFAPVDFQ
jgi:hypothetical protein